MSYSADNLDLSTLPASPLVDVDREAIIAARKVIFKTLWDAARVHNPKLPDFDTLHLAFEPAAIANEGFGVNETLILQAINDAAKELRLAQASGSNLDHLGVTYHRSERQIIRPATDTTAALYESDDAYRDRTQLAPEALADMGLTPGGYIYKIRTAFAEAIKHVFPINRQDGRVEIRVLGRDGSGAVLPATVAKIVSAFRIEEGQQSTDVLTVLSADIEEVTWDVTLYIKRGPDPATVVALAKANLQALADRLHRINETQYCEAISSAAHVGPVITTRVNSPASDRIGAPEKAYYVSAINVTAEVLP